VSETTLSAEVEAALEAVGEYHGAVSILRTALTTQQERSNYPSVPEWVALGERCEAAEARTEAALAVAESKTGRTVHDVLGTIAAILRGERNE
jgi:hypothetical protein